jgi:hypothetical protein
VEVVIDISEIEEYDGGDEAEEEAVRRRATARGDATATYTVITHSRNKPEHVKTMRVAAKR